MIRKHGILRSLGNQQMEGYPALKILECGKRRGVGSFQCAQESVGLVRPRPQFSLVSLIRSRIKQLTEKIHPTN